MSAQRDWTAGVSEIVYQTCRSCSHVWYFHRSFCPSCGAREPESKETAGEGVVYAISVVTRAATPEARAHVPYAVVLVDLAEGFRMMGHGARDLAVGDPVSAGFTQFTGLTVPYFERRKT